MITYKSTFILTLSLAIVFFVTGYFLPLDLESAKDGSNLSSVKLGLGQILYNNLKASIFVIFFGGITLGFYYLFYLLQNFLSMAMIISQLNHDIGLFNTLSTFMIHGIFEVPAMLMSAALGIYIPLTIIYSFIKKTPMLSELKKVFSLVGIVFLLTVIAALLEAFVSPNLIQT